MSAATSNLHDQFHAMLQTMKQTPAPPVLAATQPLSGGAITPLPAPPSAVVVNQKDNIGAFFKKHWGKILALCIIVVVVTVFVARYFISKRKKNMKLKEAHQDQENIQWEQYFGNEQAALPSPQGPQGQVAPPQQQPQPQQPSRPSQRPAVPPQIQQIQAQLNGSLQQQPHSQHSPQQQPHHQQLQQQAPAPQRPPVPPLSAVQPAGASAPSAPPAQPVDPRLAAAGISLPQRQPKEKEAELPKSDTDQRGEPVKPTQPAGRVIDDIVVA